MCVRVCVCLFVCVKTLNNAGLHLTNVRFLCSFDVIYLSYTNCACGTDCLEVLMCPQQVQSHVFIKDNILSFLRGVKMDKGTCKPFKTLMSVTVCYGHQLFFLFCLQILPPDFRTMPFHTLFLSFCKDFCN